MKKILYLFIVLILPIFAAANDPNSANVDSVYVKNIQSIIITKNESQSTFPIFELGKESLNIAFDDIDADVKNYIYTVDLCNENWTLSSLTTNEYIEGFFLNRIEYPKFSFGTYTNYTHYDLRVPNNNLRLTKSGNYILKIFEDINGDKKLVFSRRIIATEKIVALLGEVVNSTNIGNYNTHQEVRFDIINKDNKIISPQQELKATVIQNGRWGGAISGLKPNLLLGEKVQFNYLGKVVFSAGKEFRWLDLTSLIFRTDRVDKIKDYDKYREVTMLPDRVRNGLGYLIFRDINGEFYISNQDNTVNPQLGADYAFVLFNLQMLRPIPDAEIHVVGAFNNWKINDESMLEYVPSHHAYAKEIFLKQGYYNYEYVVVPNDTKVPSHELTEGDWYEAENNYQVIVYYRPFGARYDRVIAAKTINTSRF